MMSVLVFTVPQDFHAEAVCWGLEQVGVRAERVYLSDIPQKESLSYSLDTPDEILLGSSGRSIRALDFSTIWLRRMGAMTPRSDLHPGDLRFVLRDWRLMRGFVETLLEDGGFCVNAPSSFARADSKPFQLRAARASGLNVPDTLISNEPELIRGFILSNERRGHQTILKPLATAMWKTPDGRDIALGTHLVTIDDVDAADVASGPSIYQPKIEKAFEVRVTVMGSTLIAARLDTQGRAEAHVDFRRLRDWRALKCDAINVPGVVADRVLELCKHLSVVFGSIDFIVDLEGNWVFLEINEMGNFLWVEQVNPEIPLLDSFVQFLARPSADFRYDPGGGPRLRFDHFREQVFDLEAYRREQEEHVIPPDRSSVIEAEL